MKPYDDTVYSDNGDGYSGWWDSHTVGTPDGTWNDDDYKGPDDYVYRNTNTKEIVDYGEMGGSGTADNHALMVAQIKEAGGQSYDLQDHQEILDAYDAFLDKWGFRPAFPTAQGLLQSIGNKQYDYWSNVIESARLSDASDYLTLSGWESTAIEDHSGLVDNLRNFHGDPALIRDRLAPLLPVAKPRHTVLRVGEADMLDLYLLNETNLPTHGPLRLTLTDPLRQNDCARRLSEPRLRQRSVRLSDQGRCVHAAADPARRLPCHLRRCRCPADPRPARHRAPRRSPRCASASSAAVRPAGRAERPGRRHGGALSG